MFPLGQDTLMILKAFVLFTCICFWLKIAIDALFRRHGIGRFYSSRHRH